MAPSPRETIPGVWQQVAKGATTVANNATVTVATVKASSGDILYPIGMVRTTTGDAIQEFSGSAPGGQDNMVRQLRKTANADEHELRLFQRNVSQASVVVDWILLRITPA